MTGDNHSERSAPPNRAVPALIACGGAGCLLLARARQTDQFPANPIAIDAEDEDIAARFANLESIELIQVAQCRKHRHRVSSASHACMRRKLLPTIGPLVERLVSLPQAKTRGIAIWASLAGHVGGHTTRFISATLAAHNVRHSVVASVPFPFETCRSHRAAQWQLRHLRRTADRIVVLDTAGIQAALGKTLTVHEALKRADPRFLELAGDAGHAQDTSES